MPRYTLPVFARYSTLYSIPPPPLLIPHLLAQGFLLNHLSVGCVLRVASRFQLDVPPPELVSLCGHARFLTCVSFCMVSRRARFLRPRPCTPGLGWARTLSAAVVAWSQLPPELVPPPVVPPRKRGSSASLRRVPFFPGPGPSMRILVLILQNEEDHR